MTCCNYCETCPAKHETKQVDVEFCAAAEVSLKVSELFEFKFTYTNLNISQRIGRAFALMTKVLRECEC